MRQSNATRLARAERDLRNAEDRLARATYYADLAHSRGDLLHEGERDTWNRCHDRVLQLRARVAVRREAVLREQQREIKAEQTP